jgi:hypothetical protein
MSDNTGDKRGAHSGRVSGFRIVDHSTLIDPSGDSVTRGNYLLLF